jgi:hypothetical protein
MTALNISEYVQSLGLQARMASASMARADAATKNKALRRLADLLRANVQALQADNAKDLERASAAGLAAPLVDRLGAAPQDAGVAALDREAGRLDGHIGPALEDHAEHAERNAHLADADAAGLLLQADDLADDVRHRGQLFAALRHGFDDLRRELEAVHHRWR